MQGALGANTDGRIEADLVGLHPHILHAWGWDSPRDVAQLKPSKVPVHDEPSTVLGFGV